MSGPGLLPADPAFAWSFVVLAGVLGFLGCGTALLLVLLGGVPVHDAITSTLWLIGGTVLILFAGRLGLLRRLGAGLVGFLTARGRP